MIIGTQFAKKTGLWQLVNISCKAGDEAVMWLFKIAVYQSDFRLPIFNKKTFIVLFCFYIYYRTSGPVLLQNTLLNKGIYIYQRLSLCLSDKQSIILPVNTWTLF